MFVAVGCWLLVYCQALAGKKEWDFRFSLTLNGVVCNKLFIGANNLVTTCYRQNERGKAQALNDFLVFGTTAAASFLAGFLHEHFGWVPLNWASIPLLLVAVCAVIWLRYQREPVRAAA